MKSIEWAAQCAAEYAKNPTPARAHNAAQHLGPALEEILRLQTAIAELAALRSRRPAFYLTDRGEQAIAAQRKGAERGDGQGPQEQPHGREGGGDPDQSG